MVPWKGLLFAILLVIATAIVSTCHAARLLSEPSVDGNDTSSIATSLSTNSSATPDLSALAGTSLPAGLPNLSELPPGTDLTALASSLPDETKAKLASSAGVSLPDIPDLPDLSVNIPEFAMPPITSPVFTMFGHEVHLPNLSSMVGNHY
ncbi:unnamed protein product [Musa hybrid cultivar]